MRAYSDWALLFIIAMAAAVVVLQIRFEGILLAMCVLALVAARIAWELDARRSRQAPDGTSGGALGRYERLLRRELGLDGRPNKRREG